MLLMTKEVAGTFDVHITTSRRASRTGRLPFERLDNRYRFDLDTVREARWLHGFTQSDTADGLRATAGESRRCAQPTRPRLGKTGACIAKKTKENT